MELDKENLLIKYNIMPLQIKERAPHTYNVVKPRKQLTTEREAMKKTAGSVQPETLKSLSKRGRQNAPDLTGNSGFKAPSQSENDGGTRMTENLGNNYAAMFFGVGKGHNMGSVRPGYSMNKAINATDYFR